jgi:hypothetical protein
MNAAARGWLYLIAAVQLAVGLAALFAPQMVAARFDLLPQTLKGAAEIRGLYGGGFTASGLLTLLALRDTPLARGLLVAVGSVMGGIAAARLVSLCVEHEIAFTLPAAVAEALTALACRVLYRRSARF